MAPSRVLVASVARIPGMVPWRSAGIGDPLHILRRSRGVQELPLFERYTETECSRPSSSALRHVVVRSSSAALLTASSTASGTVWGSVGLPRPPAISLHLHQLSFSSTHSTGPLDPLDPLDSVDSVDQRKTLLCNIFDLLKQHQQQDETHPDGSHDQTQDEAGDRASLLTAIRVAAEQYCKLAWYDVADLRSFLEAVPQFFPLLAATRGAEDEAPQAQHLESAELHCLLARAYNRAGDPWRAEAHADVALGLSIPSSIRGHLQHHRAQAMVAQGRADRAFACLLEALQLRGGTGLTDVNAELDTVRAERELELGRPVLALASASEALGLARTLRDDAILARVLGVQARVLAEFGHCDHAVFAASEAFHLDPESSQAQTSVVQVLGVVHQGHPHLHQDSLAPSHATFFEDDDISNSRKRRKSPWLQAFSRLIPALLGATPRAGEALSSALQELANKRAPSPLLKSSLLCARAMHRWRQGEYCQLEEDAQLALEALEGCDEVVKGNAYLVQSMANFWGHRGDSPDSVRQYPVNVLVPGAYAHDQGSHVAARTAFRPRFQALRCHYAAVGELESQHFKGAIECATAGLESVASCQWMALAPHLYCVRGWANLMMGDVRAARFDAIRADDWGRGNSAEAELITAVDLAYHAQHRHIPADASWPWQHALAQDTGFEVVPIELPTESVLSRKPPERRKVLLPQYRDLYEAWGLWRCGVGITSERGVRRHGAQGRCMGSGVSSPQGCPCTS